MLQNLLYHPTPVPVSEVEGLEVEQVFLGRCTNGRFEDLELLFEFLMTKGEKGDKMRGNACPKKVCEMCVERGAI